MIDAETVNNHVHRKLNRINSNFSGYLRVPDVDEYINEAVQVWVKNRALFPEINSDRRNDLRKLEIKGKKLKFTSESDRVVAELPKDFFKRIGQEAVGSIGCENCNCDNRVIKIRIKQSGEISDLLSDPYWKPSFEWGETIGDEDHRGLHVWHNGEFTIDEITIDYIRKPKEVRTPSLMAEGYYTIGTKRYSTNSGLELDETHQINEITDLAALFILRDYGDGQEYQSQIDKILRTKNDLN